ncbi:MAG: BlaI/MecI/CopY family transcriptional regulator [Pirellulaceae bacterium]|nr:BlaI/MecI/CopY family transcriptional regulator [Pirellulaceae bacterium]
MGVESLANAELAVMELLWEADRLTARQIRDQLYPGESRSANGTVQRLLQRLEAKSFIERDRDLPVHLFSALIGREAYAGNQLKSLADQLTGGSLVPAITHLLDENQLSRAEITRLREILKGGKS